MIIFVFFLERLYCIHWSLRWYFRTVIQTKEEKLILFKERKQELVKDNQIYFR